MNLLLGLPFLVLVWGLLLPLLFLDGARAYLAFLWDNPRVVAGLSVNLGVLSYWLARRLSQALLLRSTGANLRATHEPPCVGSLSRRGPGTPGRSPSAGLARILERMAGSGRR